MECILGFCLPHNFQKLEGTVPICSKVGGGASTAVPACSKVGGDASHGSHRVVAPMLSIHINDHRRQKEAIFEETGNFRSVKNYFSLFLDRDLLKRMRKYINYSGKKYWYRVSPTD